MNAETGLHALRAEHIGSLVHPDPLREVFQRHDRYEAGDDELQRAQDEAIQDIIRKQEAVGLQVVGDGGSRPCVSYRPGAMAAWPACGHAHGALALARRSSSGRLSSQW